MNDSKSCHRAGGADSTMASSSTPSAAKRKSQYQSRAARSIWLLEHRLSSLESKRTSTSLSSSDKGSAAADLDSDLNDFGLMYNTLDDRLADLEASLGNGARKGHLDGTKGEEDEEAEKAGEELKLLESRIAELEDAIKASREGEMDERLSSVEEQLAKVPFLGSSLGSKMEGVYERLDKVEKTAIEEPAAAKVAELIDQVTDRLEAVEAAGTDGDKEEFIAKVDALHEQFCSIEEQFSNLQGSDDSIQQTIERGDDETFARASQMVAASDKNAMGRFHDISKRLMHLEQQQSKRSDNMDTVHTRLQWLEGEASKEPREPKAIELSHRVHRLHERLSVMEKTPNQCNELVATQVGLRVDELHERLAKLEKSDRQPAYGLPLEERINSLDRQIIWKDEAMRHRVSALERNAVKTTDVDERVKRLVQQLADADSTGHDRSTLINNAKLADKVQELDRDLLTKETDWNARLDDLERRLPKGPSIAYSNDLIRRMGELEARLKQTGSDLSPVKESAPLIRDVDMSRRVEDREKLMTSGPSMKILESVQARLASLERTVTSTNASSIDSAKRVFDLELKFQPYKEYQSATRDAVQNLKNLEGAISTYKGEMVEEKRLVQNQQQESSTRIALAEADIKVLTAWIEGLKDEVKTISAPRTVSTGALIQSLLERLDGGETLDTYNAFRLKAKLDSATSKAAQDYSERVVQGSSSRGGDVQQIQRNDGPEEQNVRRGQQGAQQAQQGAQQVQNSAHQMQQNGSVGQGAQRTQQGIQQVQGAQQVQHTQQGQQRTQCEPQSARQNKQDPEQRAQSAQQGQQIAAQVQPNGTTKMCGEQGARPEEVPAVNGNHQDQPKAAEESQRKQVGARATVENRPAKRPNPARSDVDERPVKRPRTTPTTDAISLVNGLASGGRGSSSTLSSVVDDFEETPSTRTRPSRRRRESSQLDTEDGESSPEIRRTSRTFKPTKRQEEYERTKTEKKRKVPRRLGKGARGSGLGLGLSRRRVRFPRG